MELRRWADARSLRSLKPDSAASVSSVAAGTSALPDIL